MGLSWSKRKAFPFYPITAASSNSLAGRADHSVFMFMGILTMSFEGDERTNVIIYMCVYRRAREYIFVEYPAGWKPVHNVAIHSTIAHMGIRVDTDVVIELTGPVAWPHTSTAPRLCAHGCCCV